MVSVAAPALAPLFAVLGVVVGSFIGLVSLRLPAGQPVIMGRSRCGGCERPLAPWNLIPVLSYLALAGRCRRCGSRIPVRYPLIELLCAGLGLWALAVEGSLGTALITAGFGWALLLIALIDAEHLWLPDVLTWPLLGGGLAAAWLMQPELVHRLMGALVGYGSLWLIAAVYRRLRGREGLGGGDPWLFAATGAWVGWTGLPSVLLWACLAGFSLVLARLITRRPVSGEDELPLGVFLALGAWLTWLYGPIGG